MMRAGGPRPRVEALAAFDYGQPILTANTFAPLKGSNLAAEKNAHLSMSTTHSSRFVLPALICLMVLCACKPNAATDEGPTSVPPRPEQEPQEAPPDLSSDDALAAAYKAQTGRELGDECIERPDSFGNVVAVGVFAHDYGCMDDGFFVDGEWTDGIEEATRRALTAMDWEQMSAGERQVFASKWIEEVVFAMGPSVVERSSKAFELDDTPGFEPMEAATAEDGTTVVTLWTREPAGMVREQAFTRYEYRFGENASSSSEPIDDFAVSFDRLR